MTEQRKCQSITEWLSEYTGQGGCRPCGASVLKAHYEDLLKTKGYSSIADELSLITTQDITSTGSTLDGIKTKVDKDTCQELRQLDCLIQETIEDLS